MFKKKNCGNCGNKMNIDYDFCPYCGKSSKNKDNYGLLGRKDISDESDLFSNSLFNGISGKFLDKMMTSAIRMLEKEMKNTNNVPFTKNIRLMINGKEIPLGNETQTSKRDFSEEKMKNKTKTLDIKKIKKISKLPKEEPETKIRRIGEHVLYELNLPEVNSIEDISITKLESSIEIKALGKNKAYIKRIPLNLPIINYNLNKGKLTLELGG